MQRKVVFITGASSGIGKALAMEYARNNYDLVLSARRAELLEEVKKQCLASGANCHILLMDMENSGEIASKTTEAIGFFGRIDILVNNAGISQRGKAIDTSLDLVRKMMDINFFGAIGVTHALLPELKKNKGNIVVISSMSGLFGFPLRSTYSASKFALNGYFETLALEEPEIAVTIVCPGRIKTDISLHAMAADGSKHGVMDNAQINGIDVHVCARKIYSAVKNRKHLIIIARGEKVLYWIKKFSLPLFYSIARKIKPT
jgi:dehydrogenase/reductase SDR family protein 7B